jgi:hypothetical protein
MTSRTRPGPRRTTESRPAPLLALALGALLAPALGCYSLSRPVFAQHDAGEAKTLEQVDAVVGADPMLEPLWVWSAQRRASPQQSLAVVESGRRFHPLHPELVLAQIDLLGMLHRDDDAKAAVAAALATECPPQLEKELRWLLILSELAQNDVAAAEAEVVRLGGVSGVPPGQVAFAWARIAAAQEFLGQPEPADASMESSLDLGPAGLVALREVAMREPQRQAACDSLVDRARARHPAHPDLALQPVFRALMAQDAAAADKALAALPEPMPERLQPNVELLRVQADILAGRTDAALAVVRARLDEDPTDAQALGALIACWRLRQVPSKDEVRLRLSWAAGRVPDPAIGAQVQALLRELSAQPATPKAAPTPAPAPPAPAAPADGARP